MLVNKIPIMPCEYIYIYWNNKIKLYVLEQNRCLFAECVQYL